MSNNSEPSEENTEEEVERKTGKQTEQRKKRSEPKSQEESEEEQDEEEGKKEKGRGWFEKIPKDKLFTPGGAILLAFALATEILDILLPDFVIPGASLVVEIIPELIFILLLKMFFSVSFISLVIPFLIERIPIISDIVPTWFIKMIA